MKQQLHIQADGISGHLDEFWPDIMNSAWIGGPAEGWERMPYWLDGIIPLSCVLDDERLKDTVSRYIREILDRQAADGWLGPEPPDRARHDIWSLFLALKMLVQFADASECAVMPDLPGRFEDAVSRTLRCIDRHIDTAPLFNWAQFRWFEALIAIYWLYEKTGEPWLIDLAVKLNAQGFNYGQFFRRWPLTEPTPHGRWNYAGHAVNNAMAIKAHALWWRLTGDDEDRKAVYDIIGKLALWHGMATGVFTGDECLAGLDPTHGTELCAVVEHMFSLETVAGIFADPIAADQLEKIAFNALPATFSPDMWSHQYDQQVNQVECSVREGRKWNSNGPDANIFGVEPNFGCCTANLSQGWPKFASHLWMKTDGDGLAALAYAPCRLDSECCGTAVVVRVDTDYPFRDKVLVSVTVAGAARFPLLFRIPEWCDAPSISIGGTPMACSSPGSFLRIEREWSGTTEIVVHLPMKVRAVRRYRGALSLGRGPLVFSLPIAENWRRINEDKPYRDLPHADWEVLPAGDWNYALSLRDSESASDIAIAERTVGDCPFSPSGAPVTMSVRGAKVPDWNAVDGSVTDVPESPVAVDATTEDLTLIPYGCTNLRITEFPTTG